jgi:WD40 repeat protein
MQILRGRRHGVQELAFSHCGRWLAAAGSTGGLHVWDTVDPTAKPQNPAIPGGIRPGSLIFRTDGRVFVNTYSCQWFLYDPVARARTDIGGTRTSFVVPSPDGRRVVRVGEPTPLRTWVLGANDKPGAGATVQRTGWRIATACFAPDCATFATAEATLPGPSLPAPGLTIRAADTAKPICALKGTFVCPLQMAFSRDGAHILECSSASLACWTVAEPDRAPRKAVNPSRKFFVSMAVHPSGPLLTVDNDRLVRVWSVPELTPFRAIAWDIGKLYAVVVSPDGARAAVGSHTGKVLVWDWD